MMVLWVSNPHQSCYLNPPCYVIDSLGWSSMRWAVCLGQRLVIQIPIMGERKVMDQQGINMVACVRKQTKLLKGRVGGTISIMLTLCHESKLLVLTILSPSGASILSRHILDQQIRWLHISEGSRSVLLPKVWASCCCFFFLAVFPDLKLKMEHVELETNNGNKALTKSCCYVLHSTHL